MHKNIDTKELNRRPVKNTMATWLFMCGIILTCICMGCEEDEPIINENYKPGKRDYVWSIDNVDYGDRPSKIQIEAMWGSSANDVWGVAGDASDVRDCLWHYNGIKWTRATAGTPITEFTGNKTLYNIWGSAQNDVWAFGRKILNDTLSAFIMHFDGVHWVDATPSNVVKLKSILYSVYGTSKNDIWVGGYEYALHYTGNQWITYKISDSLIVNSVTVHEGVPYFFLYSPWGRDSIYLYMFKDNILKNIDKSNPYYPKFGGGLFTINSELKTIATGVISTTFKQDGTIDKDGWKKEFETATYFREKYIQSNRNIFLVGVYNLIYHNNGINWHPITIQVPNHTVDPYSDLWGVWADGNEVFISDVENGIIYHGR